MSNASTGQLPRIARGAILWSKPFSVWRTCDALVGWRRSRLADLVCLNCHGDVGRVPNEVWRIQQAGDDRLLIPRRDGSGGTLARDARHRIVGRFDTRPRRGVCDAGDADLRLGSPDLRDDLNALDSGRGPLTDGRFPNDRRADSGVRLSRPDDRQRGCSPRPGERAQASARGVSGNVERVAPSQPAVSARAGSDGAFSYSGFRRFRERVTGDHRSGYLPTERRESGDSDSRRFPAR